MTAVKRLMTGITTDWCRFWWS